jgi:hypothetical protein
LRFSTINFIQNAYEEIFLEIVQLRREIQGKAEDTRRKESTYFSKAAESLFLACYNPELLMMV